MFIISYTCLNLYINSTNYNDAALKSTINAVEFYLDLVRYKYFLIALKT